VVIREPALQLALDLLNFCYVVCSECQLSPEDYVQHVNECVGRDVYQFSEHGQLPRANLKIAFCIRNPAATPAHAEVSLKRLQIKQIGTSATRIA
jgi:hypothetical protein